MRPEKACLLPSVFGASVYGRSERVVNTRGGILAHSQHNMRIPVDPPSRPQMCDRNDWLAFAGGPKLRATTNLHQAADSNAIIARIADGDPPPSSAVLKKASLSTTALMSPLNTVRNQADRPPATRPTSTAVFTTVASAPLAWVFQPLR